MKHLLSRKTKLIVSLLFFQCLLGCEKQVLNANQNSEYENFEEYPEAAKIFAVEMQLLSVRLGMPYLEAIKALTKIYGNPTQNTIQSATFRLTKNNQNTITIASDNERFPALFSAEVKGNAPIPHLNFYANLNLGEPEKNIREKFAFVNTNPRLIKGERIYEPLSSNYIFKAKNGKVSSLKIWVVKPVIEIVKTKNQSVGLSPNERILAHTENGKILKDLNLKPKITKLIAETRDALRSLCESRIPLRLWTTQPFIDATLRLGLSKYGKIPVTYILDTGAEISWVGASSCRQYQCGLSDHVKVLYNSNISSKKSPYEWAGLAKIQNMNLGDMMLEKSLSIMENGLKENSAFFPGLIGNHITYQEPVFIDFKHGYLCYLNKSNFFESTAKKIGLKKIKAHKTKKFYMRANIEINRQVLQDVVLDSGNNHISITEIDLKKVGLKKVNKTYFFNRSNKVTPDNKSYIGNTVNGEFYVDYFEIATIGWSALGIYQKTPFINAPSPIGRSLIGMPFLRHFILGIHGEKGLMYIGE